MFGRARERLSASRRGFERRAYRAGRGDSAGAPLPEIEREPESIDPTMVQPTRLSADVQPDSETRRGRVSHVDMGRVLSMFILLATAESFWDSRGSGDYYLLGLDTDTLQPNYDPEMVTAKQKALIDGMMSNGYINHFAAAIDSGVEVQMTDVVSDFINMPVPVVCGNVAESHGAAGVYHYHREDGNPLSPIIENSGAIIIDYEQCDVLESPGDFTEFEVGVATFVLSHEAAHVEVGVNEVDATCFGLEFMGELSEAMETNFYYSQTGFSVTDAFVHLQGDSYSGSEYDVTGICD